MAVNAPVEPPAAPVEEPPVVPVEPELGEEPDIQIAAPSPPPQVSPQVSDDQILAGELHFQNSFFLMHLWVCIRLCFVVFYKNQYALNMELF